MGPPALGERDYTAPDLFSGSNTAGAFSFSSLALNATSRIIRSSSVLDAITSSRSRSADGRCAVAWQVETTVDIAAIGWQPVRLGTTHDEALWTRTNT